MWEGWSKELKTQEHKDLFLRLKAGRKKVVYCPSFRIKNEHNEKGLDIISEKISGHFYDKKKYNAERYGRYGIMSAKFLNHWNIAEEIIQRRNNTKT